MNLNSPKTIIDRLRRGAKAREQFIASHLNKGVSYQLRATREKLGWSQERLAEETGMNQNAISRLESPHYGRPTLTTLRRLASAMDVGLIVRFVPFSEMVDWVTSTPHLSRGLTEDALAVPSFGQEEAVGIFDSKVNLQDAASTGKVVFIHEDPADEKVIIAKDTDEASSRQFHYELGQQTA